MIKEWLAAMLVMFGVVLIGRDEATWSLVVGSALLTFGIRLAIDLGKEG